MKYRGLLISLACVFISGSVFVGAAQIYIPVTIDYNVMWAQGFMLAARTSHNDVEHIGCSVTQRADGSNNGFCNARDPDGNEIRCWFFDNEFLTRAVHGINDYSYVGFGWDENEDCTVIRVSHRSFYLPKK